MPSLPHQRARSRSVRAPASLMLYTPSLVAVVLAIALNAEIRAASAHEFTQIHMGLPVRLVLHAPDRNAAEAAARAAFRRIADLDRLMSDYRPDSELRAIERSRAPVRVSAEMIAVLWRAVEIARATGGAFDPTVGPLVALWREARAAHRLPDPAAIESARSRVGWRHLEA